MDGPSAQAYIESLDEERIRVSVAGELDMQSSDEIEHRVAPLVKEGHRVDFDLGEVSYLDSAGLRVLFRVARRAAPGQITLENPGVSVRKILDISGIEHLENVRVQPPPDRR